MKNAKYKDRGFGTRAEQLAIQYVFDKLDIPVLYADSILSNTRSQHVLEKVGFQFIKEEGEILNFCTETVDNWKKLAYIYHINPTETV